MKPPPGSTPDSTVMHFIYEKDGRRYEWSPEQLPADYETYTFVDRIDKLVRKGNADPKIKGFTLADTLGQDHTPELLAHDRAVIIFAMDAGKRSWLDELVKITDAARKKNIPLYIATSNREQMIENLIEFKTDVPVYACDFTVMRTAARTDPTIYFLKRGTIENKYSVRELEKVPVAIQEF